MRLLLLLPLLLLVGCNTNTKPPTYLGCTNLDNEWDSVEYRWIVLDHANDLWISSSWNIKPNNRDTDKVLVDVIEFDKDDNYYFHSDPETSNFKLNRKTLIYRSFVDEFQCVLLDDLSYMHSLGLEKAKEELNKI